MRFISASEEARPLQADEFAALIAPLGPFEPNPVIAVAVSGGADSMALLHLAAEWAAARDGRVFALTVDHGLRAEAASEAARVARWAAGLGVAHETLTWRDPRPDLAAVQDRARQARYDLLAGAAAARGILHIALAHHAEDQAETVLLRLAKGSGVDGLAGMAALTETAWARLLRPLLAAPPARLRATCRARGQDWIEDPSNRSEKYARPRLRAAAEHLAGEGLTPHTLGLTARRMGAARAALENMTAALLAEAVMVFPQGYAELNLHIWSRADTEIRRRALGQMLRVIGGERYAPRGEQLDLLLARLAAPDFSGATLGGCVIEPRAGRLLIMREDRNLSPPCLLAAGETGRWDRFELFAARPAEVKAPHDALPPGIAAGVPRTVAQTQPAFFDEKGLMAVPTLGYYRAGGTPQAFAARFSPLRALAESIFAIV